MVWNGETPFEMKTIEAQPDGFKISFTQPVDVKSAKDVASYAVKNFTYQYHHNYGSPVINQGNCAIKAIEVSADRLSVRLVVDSLKLGYIHEIRAEGVLSNQKNTLLHSLGYYTLNQIPDGDKMVITEANKVVPAMQHNHAMMTDKNVNADTTKKAVVAVAAKHLTKQPAAWKNGAERTIKIGTLPGLKYDLETITVKANAKVKLIFNNNDDMLHNMVITKPDAANNVGEAATKLGLNGEKLWYVPDSPDVLFHTKLLAPSETETIFFTAPDKPGKYPFECTYPGHYLVMKGMLVVTK
jgi:azurin